MIMNTFEMSTSVRSELSKDQFDKINGCIADLAVKLQISNILLVNRAGRVLAKHMAGVAHVDAETLASLVAGSHAAGIELARLLGEKQSFKSVLYEGQAVNVLISSIQDEHFLVTVFNTQLALGMVRLYVKRAIQALEPILSGPQQETDFGSIFDDKFQNLLGEELDRTLRDSF